MSLDATQGTGARTPRAAGPAGTVVALGEQALVEGFGLAGAVVRVAETAVEVEEAWITLPRSVAVVVLTPRAAAALGARRDAPVAPMSVVLP